MLVNIVLSKIYVWLDVASYVVVGGKINVDLCIATVEDTKRILVSQMESNLHVLMQNFGEFFDK